MFFFYYNTQKLGFSPIAFWKSGTVCDYIYSHRVIHKVSILNLWDEYWIKEITTTRSPICISRIPQPAFSIDPPIRHSIVLIFATMMNFHLRFDLNMQKRTILVFCWSKEDILMFEWFECLHFVIWILAGKTAMWNYSLQSKNPGINMKYFLKRWSQSPTDKRCLRDVQKMQHYTCDTVDGLSTQTRFGKKKDSLSWTLNYYSFQ